MDPDEISLESFLSSLKLSEYLLHFALNGYSTIEECYELDEARLHGIGVTKPGHIKRIISSIDKCKRRTVPCSHEDLANFDESKESADEHGTEDVLPLGSNVASNSTDLVLAPESILEDEFDEGDPNAPPLPPKKGKRNSQSRAPAPPTPQRRKSELDAEAKSTTMMSRSDSLPAMSIDPQADTLKPRRRAPMPPVHPPARSGSVTSPPPILPPRVDLGELQNSDPTPTLLPKSAETLQQHSTDDADRHKSDSFRSIASSVSTVESTEDSSSETSLLLDIEQALGRPLTPPQEENRANSLEPPRKSNDALENEQSSTLPRVAPKKPVRPIPAVRKSKLSLSSTKDLVQSPEKEPSSTIKSAADGKDDMVSNKASAKSPGSVESLPGIVVSGDDDLSGDESDHSVSDVLDETEIDDQHQQDTQILSMSKHGDLVAAQLLKGGTTDSSPSMWRRSALGSVGKAGFLDKRGGQKNYRRPQKRWVVFNGDDLRYYKPHDKDAKSESLQIVPVSRMEDVEIVSGAKRPQFNLKTPNRTFIFLSDDFNEITIWSLILMEAIQLQKIVRQQNPNVDETGGNMANPDKEGWLKKQGNNMMLDWKDRYVVVKDSKLCYYYSFEDFVLDMPINCIDMALATVKGTEATRKINIVTSKRTFFFEADSAISFLAWKDAFETAIQYGLGDPAVLKELQTNGANSVCADCGKTNPVWASVNLLVIVCAQCIGFHRRLGAQISRARSILMDVKIWTPSLIKLMLEIGNERANELWESKMPPDDKIKVDATSEAREEFISAKYKDKRYFMWSPFYGQEEELGLRLRQSVLSDDVVASLRLLVSGANVYYIQDETMDSRTPYQLADESGNELQRELIMQYNGHLNAEERERLLRPATPELQESRVQGYDVVAGPVPVAWDQQGLLSKRSSKNEPWKNKMFFLKDRSLYMDKGTKEQDLELIDLRKLTDLQFESFDGTITISFPNKSLFLKGETIDEGNAWYTAMKNKQVIGVSLQCQDVNSSKVAYLVTRCIDYIDSHGLDVEGVYRLSGSLATIKQLLVYFNQDARSVQLTVDQYPSVHDITGVLKMYLRELPEPLLTWDLYEHFTANCYETDHYTKVYRLKDLINELPEVNRCTLKAIVMHLDKIIKNDEITKMSLDNVVLIFGPSLMSKFQTTKQSVLQYEYQVVSDILTYYQWLFDLDETDLSRDFKIEEGRRKIEEAKRDMVKQTESTTISDLQFSIYIGNTDDPCSVKLTSESNASKVCWYIINLRKLPMEKNWALFEAIQDIDLERPIPGNELILPLVMSWKRENRLVLKENYVAEKTAPFQNGNLSLSGTLHIKKNDSSWKKHQFVEIKTGNLRIYSKKGASSESDNLPIHDLLLYIGIDKRKKSPCKNGFTLRTKTDVRFICTEDEESMYRWVSAILKIKYPTGIWTSLQMDSSPGEQQQGSELSTPIETSAHWGRQSMFRRPAGASLSILRDIMGRRQSLRKVK